MAGGLGVGPSNLYLISPLVIPLQTLGGDPEY